MKDGYYRIELNRTVWLIPKRYQNLTAVGGGAYGQVVSAFDDQRDRRVAIKKLTRPFQSPVHAKRAYRELKLLKHLDHDNIIGLLDVFTSDSTVDDFHDVYVVTELMGADMNTIIKTQRLTDDHVKFLVYQLLRGLKYVHSAGIIHRDLKPANIAVNEDCELKILDFGLARQEDDEMTGYVATRWYRAPEIMLNWMHYNQTADVWSVGCIMAEMLTGQTLFPGTDHIDQLNKIMAIVGTPSEDFMSKITSEDARKYIHSMSKVERRSFSDVFRDASSNAIDLLEKMLELDPDKRITAFEALAHPYLETYADPTDEPESPPYDDSFEKMRLTVGQWKNLIFKEILEFEVRGGKHGRSSPMSTSSDSSNFAVDSS